MIKFYSTLFGGGGLSEQAAQMMCVRDVVQMGSPSTSNCPLRTISQQAYLAIIAMITTGHVCAHTLKCPAVSKTNTL